MTLIPHQHNKGENTKEPMGRAMLERVFFKRTQTTDLHNFKQSVEVTTNQPPTSRNMEPKTRAQRNKIENRNDEPDKTKP